MEDIQDFKIKEVGDRIKILSSASASNIYGGKVGISEFVNIPYFIVIENNQTIKFNSWNDKNFIQDLVIIDPKENGRTYRIASEHVKIV